MVKPLEQKLGDTPYQTKDSELKLITYRELAYYLNTSKRTIIRLRENKGLTAYKIGGQYRYSASEVKAWILENEFKNDAGAAEYSNFYGEDGNPVPLITDQDVAKILRTSVTTVLRLREKDLTGFRVGGQMRFDNLLLDEWLIRHKYKP